MSLLQETREILGSLVGPWIFLTIALSFLPGSLLRLARSKGIISLLAWSRVQTAWFSAFWNLAGRDIRENRGDQIIALLQGRVSQGTILEQVQHQPLGGTVLDIGPGLGFWVDIYSAFNTTNDARVTRSRGAIPGKLKVYGVEPSTDSHSQLNDHIDAAGLKGIYEILPLGIEDIEKSDNKLEMESVDCIVTLLCLCSIPEPEKNIQELYKLLKPGGRWFLYEHVVVKRSVIIGWYQDTEHSLRQAGRWTNIDLAQPPEEPWHQVVPHIFGTLTK